MATLPGAWHYRVSTGTGWPGVSILWLGEVDSLICNFYLSMAAGRLSEQIRPWDTLASCWDIMQASNQQTCSGFAGAIITHLPYDRMCWGQFAAQWLDCTNWECHFLVQSLFLVLSSLFVIIIIVVVATGKIRRDGACSAWAGECPSAWGAGDGPAPDAAAAGVWEKDPAADAPVDDGRKWQQQIHACCQRWWCQQHQVSVCLLVVCSWSIYRSLSHFVGW